MLSFHVKFVQTDRDGWTDRQQMDIWTTVKQYAPDLSMRGHKNKLLKQEICNYSLGIPPKIVTKIWHHVICQKKKLSRKTGSR